MRPSCDAAQQAASRNSSGRHRVEPFRGSDRGRSGSGRERLGPGRGRSGSGKERLEALGHRPERVPVKARHPGERRSGVHPGAARMPAAPRRQVRALPGEPRTAGGHALHQRVARRAGAPEQGAGIRRARLLARRSLADRRHLLLEPGLLARGPDRRGRHRARLRHRRARRPCHHPAHRQPALGADHRRHRAGRRRVLRGRRPRGRGSDRRRHRRRARLPDADRAGPPVDVHRSRFGPSGPALLPLRPREARHPSP